MVATVYARNISNFISNNFIISLCIESFLLARTVRPLKQYLTQAPMKAGEEFQAVISYIENPGHFYLQKVMMFSNNEIIALYKLLYYFKNERVKFLLYTGWSRGEVPYKHDGQVRRGLQQGSV